MRHLLPAIILTLWLGTGPGLAAAQAPVPAWQAVQAVAPTAASAATVLATALDASGNVYTAGTFTGTITLGGVTLTSAGQEDVFVAKWASRGSTLVWVQQAGGSGSDQVTALAQSGRVRGRLLRWRSSFWRSHAHQRRPKRWLRGQNPGCGG